MDPITKVDHEHRKAMVAARIRHLADIFAVDVYGYAVMSNHLHVLLAIEPTAANTWSDQEIAERWVRLFPAREPEQNAEKARALSEDKNAIGIRRKRWLVLSAKNQRDIKSVLLDASTPRMDFDIPPRGNLKLRPVERTP
jgi:hypothetical protein